ncbi:MAG: MBL fold hydrolase [Bdellovibrionaceae bacterium]|nr:MBL fold hydrolase [Pseudobdellovibrionaceae bacterium]|tara:strand:- start:18938 stop:19816 length:879 start_codon:yes stop_codon:yes gene_type:complete
MLKIWSVEGNRQFLDGGSMFGNAPRAVWERWIAPDELGRIPLACRALLADLDGKKILCETGIGAFFEPKMADRFGVQNKDRHMLLENLKSLGVEPDEIDYVILSHLHFDHVGGLLPTYADIESGNDELLFKNAKYVVGEKALGRCEKPHPRDRASFIPGMYEKLTQSGRLLVIPDGAESHEELPKGVSFIYSEGHTPGQMLTRIQGDKASVIFTGDLIPGRHWIHLPITMGYDRYAEKVIDEKGSLYKTQDLETTYFYYTHDDHAAMSRIEKTDKGKFVPADVVEVPEGYSL